MKVSALPFALIIMATTTAADDMSYASHRGVEIFTVSPCHEVIAILDSELPAFPQDSDSPASRQHSFRELGQFSAMQGMAWGFILGFDTAKSGLHSDQQTTLERLRDACSTSPDTPAIQILDQLSAEQ